MMLPGSWAQHQSKFLGGRPPREFTRIRDDEMVAMGRREWQVITAGGHSPEHALFFCEADRLLIAGHQILSHMMPSVIAPVAQPEANPMKEYLGSLARLEALPPDMLVLPSHDCRFTGCMRAAFTAARASRGTAGRRDVRRTRKTNAFLIAQEVFSRVLFANPRQALGESLAHLNMLASTGRLTRAVDGDGAIAFAPA